jgi:hypothetical protein
MFYETFLCSIQSDDFASQYEEEMNYDGEEVR